MTPRPAGGASRGIIEVRGGSGNRRLTRAGYRQKSDSDKEANVRINRITFGYGTAPQWR
ncbi:hypothetical protein GCM10011608_57990 [Micromonospora sonchi]|uniref:Uncharacterized protein n=1 Tax=Micromonospora sonchi TaxID=1763543 RepID=A0A917X3B2_9ACTN|nr:hypothetical protein GCM10011608_57990 [Micromonospora sonchi]